MYLIPIFLNAFDMRFPSVYQENGGGGGGALSRLTLSRN